MRVRERACDNTDKGVDKKAQKPKGKEMNGEQNRLQDTKGQLVYK